MSRNEEDGGDPIVISGGSGFVGRALIPALLERGEAVTVLSRQPDRAQLPDGVRTLPYSALPEIKRARAVINLAGADIAGGRWTEKRRRELRASRLDTTRRLCDWMATLQTAPEVCISASAIGYYGDCGEDEVDESRPPADDFAATLCRDWEDSLSLPDACRRVILRLGVVLGPGGGALGRMLPAFRLGLGGRIGSGRQWFSWIHVDDLVALFCRALDDASLQGVYNATAPAPVRNADFARALGRALHRPAWLPAPAFALRLALGEMSTLLLGSQRVLPARLVDEAGFEFRYPGIDGALASAV